MAQWVAMRNGNLNGSTLGRWYTRSINEKWKLALLLSKPTSQLLRSRTDVLIDLGLGIRRSGLREESRGRSALLALEFPKPHDWQTRTSTSFSTHNMIAKAENVSSLKKVFFKIVRRRRRWN